MKLCVLTAAALLIVVLQAGGTTIGFDEFQTGEDALDYYNGGFGSSGTGPGPSYGVIFSPGWIVGSPDVYGELNGKSAAILGMGLVDIPAGWSGPTSFYYSGSTFIAKKADSAHWSAVYNLRRSRAFPRLARVCRSSAPRFLRVEAE